MQSRSSKQPQLQQAVMEVAMQIEEMEKKRVYLQRVQEKGLERRNLIERLQAHQRDHEKLLGEIQQKTSLYYISGIDFTEVDGFGALTVDSIARLANMPLP